MKRAAAQGGDLAGERISHQKGACSGSRVTYQLRPCPQDSGGEICFYGGREKGMGMKEFAKRLEKLLRRLVPGRVRMAAKACWNLERRYGHWRTAATGESVDADGSPLPWYTYPAIEYLRQFDVSNWDVFEFGSGNSTLFWAGRCRQVTAVEDDPEWHRALLAKIPPNVTYLFETDVGRYPDAVTRPGRSFDCIIIDGSFRKECAQAALEKLKRGGLMILDNSDWFPNTAALLRNAGLLQVDFHGFGPINGYSWTTSLFLSRDFNPGLSEGRQPLPSRAAVRVVKDQD